MTNTQDTQTQNTFRALADPTRRHILISLKQKNMSIGEVAGQFDMTRAAVKKHLSILERGELISVQRKGRKRINQLEPKALRSVTDWLNHFNQYWDTHLNKLQQLIDQEKRGTND